MQRRLLGGSRILVVDDEPQVCVVLQRMLASQGAVCTSAASVAEARNVLEADASFQLVVSDLNMPGESGVDFVRSLASGSDHIAVLVISGGDDPELAAKVIDLGAYGYIKKPFSLNEIVINVHSALRRRTLERERRRARERSEHALQEETVQHLAAAAELRDVDTGKHIARMSEYTAIIARRLGLSEERIELLRIASPMHDVGKIGIPDSVLLKPGKLSAEERRAMEEHAKIGHSILADSQTKLLRMGALLALTHHERWDGSGYPHGLPGEEIPIEGRIAAVADVFDALTSDRVYRPAYDVRQALEIMAAQRGHHFDPQVFDAFLDALGEILAVRERLTERLEPADRLEAAA